MLVSKLEQDIKLLEKQLKEIDVNISDPIERNEQKKQLSRKINKLEKSRSQIEKLEKEQQELESLKSEFSPNNNESVEQIESEADEQIEQISPITDNSIDTESKANFNQQLDETSSTKATTKESKSTIATSTVAIKIKHLLVLGLILGSVITAGLIINYNLTKKVEETKLKDLARRETIKAKEEAEQARQEKIEAQRERQEAIQAKEEAEQARQEAIQAKQEADDLIRNNSQVPLQQQNQTSQPSVFCDVINIQRGQLALRFTPDGESRAGLNNGNTVRPLQQQGIWSYVQIVNGPNSKVNGLEGWVNSNYLACYDDA